MLVDIAKFQMQNIEVTPTGLRTRRGLVSHKTPTSGTSYVAAFSVPSPNTTEVWHHLFEQTTASGLVTLRVYTEEFFELFSVSLGVMQQNPVITWAQVQRQLMVNSPAFTGPLYGLVGGGLITGVKKTSSINEDTTALDLMAGHIAQFGDRIAIAAGAICYFNDPGLDPRTFVVENAVEPGGAIYDMFQGPDNGFYFFTSTGAYTMPVDALGQGQEVRGAIFPIPGVITSRPRNAAASVGAVAVLQKDHLLILPNTKIPLFPQRRGVFSQVVEVDDLRKTGEVYPSPDGFWIGFGTSRSGFCRVNVLDGTVSWVDAQGATFKLAGVLTSRDGEALPVTTANVLQFFSRGPTDPYSGIGVVGVAAGDIKTAADDNPVVRHVTVAADNVGAAVAVAVDGEQDAGTTKVRATSDNIIGTTSWGTVPLVGRATRSTRLSLKKRSSAPLLEVKVVGADFALRREVDVELKGQGRGRRDSQ